MGNETQFWLEHLDGSRVRIEEPGIELGSGAMSAFRVLDSRISIRHARIEVRGSEAFLAPLGVATCQLNGVEIEHPKVLKDGDWLALAPGQLFRFAATRTAPLVWRVRLGSVEHTLQPGDQLSIPGGALMVSRRRTLELRLKDAAQYLGQQLRPSVLNWALGQGAQLRLFDGTLLTVLDSPARPERSQCWFMWGQLCYRPPDRCAALSPDGILHLGYTERDLYVDVGRAIHLVKALLLSAGHAVLLSDYGDAEMLLRLREAIIMAGGDGFSLLQTTMGRVRLVVGDGVHPSIGEPLEVHTPARRQFWWLCSEDGSCWMLGQHGLLMGRHEDCDIVFEAPYVHRYHALIELIGGRPVLSALGRHATFIGGSVLRAPTVLTEGDELRVEPGRRMWLTCGLASEPLTPPYQLSLSDGRVVTYRQERVEVGSSTEADLCLPGWSVQLTLVWVAARLYAQLHEGTAQLDGQPIQPGKFYSLAPGARLSVGDDHLEVHSLTSPAVRTKIEQIAVQPHARGGRARMRMSDGTVRAIGLGRDLLVVLQLLLEAAVGSRLRGLIETRPSVSMNGMALPRPLGAMALQELRQELLSERRISLTTLIGLIEQLRGRLLLSGIDGFELIQHRDRWVWLQLEPSSIVDLYQ